MSEIVAPPASPGPSTEGKYMVDAYENWAKAEGAPVHTGFSFDLNTLVTGSWPRFGVNGAFCHLDGRCDYLTMWMLDIAAGKSTTPQQPMSEAICHVVSGRGTATIETAEGKQSFDFGSRAVFAIPMNARYSFKADAAARIAVVSDFRYMIELYRSEKFMFGNPARPAKRGPSADNNQPVTILGAPTIETDIVADLNDCPVQPSTEAGVRTMRILPDDCILGVDLSEIAAGTNIKARLQLPGTITFCVSGQGHTTVWTEGESNQHRIDWKPGMVFAPGLQMSHQHFNTGTSPARLLGIQYGSVRFPMARDKTLVFGKQP
jgi:mannose-6-phosphate isomerase-like protein (cupin superfamily)